MSSNTDLEIKGSLRDNRFAELLVEVSQTSLTGSLRASNAAQKIVVYFDAGAPIFAVSNARFFRLFELLLRERKVTAERLTGINDFTNDLALNSYLLKANLFSKAEMDEIFSKQIGQILKDAFDWRGGEWIFSPLVRLKGDIRFKVDTPALLVEYARALPAAELTRSFKISDATFTVNAAPPAGVNLQPEEAFVFSRFDDSSLTVAEIGLTSGLTDAATERVLYVLWLGGFLTRQKWNPAFSSRQISYILAANLSLKKGETQPLTKAAEVKISVPPPVLETLKPLAAPPEIDAAETPITLEEYLERTENSANYYRFFDVAPDAPAAEIKNSYFMLARRFHPDLFHRQVDEKKLQQIQSAFTKVAHAYETLKNEKTRTVYDYKMRKELAEMEKQSAAGTTDKDAPEKLLEQARAEFEQGFELLANEDYQNAIPFLARAAHFAKDNARYRAFYGTALASDDKLKHKAEAELQAAVKLDPNNAALRLMLAEFFMRMRLPKRAEGELNRLLTIFPDNREARALLDSLPKR